jgi:hypothetical protein
LYRERNSEKCCPNPGPAWQLHRLREYKIWRSSFEPYGRLGLPSGRGARGDRNQADAEAIYGILEKEVIPIYYNVSEGGVFHDWVSVMKESIKGNAARFSARRMVKEYIEKFYFKSMEGVLKD